MAGRLIARQRSRDEPVRLSEGVVLISPSFPATYGGAMKYPKGEFRTAKTPRWQGDGRG